MGGRTDSPKSTSTRESKMKERGVGKREDTYLRRNETGEKTISKSGEIPTIVGRRERRHVGQYFLLGG